MLFTKTKPAKESIVFVFVALSFLSLIKANAQNVGIGTTNPQATLDVKGNQRIGGTSHFVSFDSASGKFTWSNSNLWVPSPQYLMLHSASAEGLYYGNSQLEYRASDGTPRFYTNWNTGNGYFYGNLGVGITSPGARLHVVNGSSGYNNGYFPGAIIEGNTNTYLNFLTPDGSESGILFGKATDAASGGIIYNNNTSYPNALQFRTNGNATRMLIDQSGNVGIGTQFPASKLEVTFDGASNFGTSLLLNQTAIGNSDGPKIQFRKAMTSTKSWTAGILNGVNVGTFSINEDAGTFGFGTSRMAIAPGGNVGIGNTNPGYLLDVSQRMRLRSGGNNSASAGMWLNNNSNAEAAFIGMEDDTHVGLYGNNGAGWKFGMNTQTGALKINGTEGQAGQVITSAGSGTTSWTFPVKTYQWGVPTSISFQSPTEVSFVNQNITVSSNSIFIISAQIGMLTNTCCTGSNAFAYLYVDGAKKAVINMGCPVNAQSSNVLANFMQPVSAGTHSVELKIQLVGGQAFSIYEIWNGGSLMSYVSVMVIGN